MNYVDVVSFLSKKFNVVYPEKVVSSLSHPNWRLDTYDKKCPNASWRWYFVSVSDEESFEAEYGGSYDKTKNLQENCIQTMIEMDAIPFRVEEKNLENDPSYLEQHGKYFKIFVRNPLGNLWMWIFGHEALSPGPDYALVYGKESEDPLCYDVDLVEDSDEFWNFDWEAPSKFSERFVARK